jgi:hypothetical protein
MNEIKLIQPYYPNAPFECFTNLDQSLDDYFDFIYDTTFPFTVSPRFFYQSSIKFTLRDTYWYIDKLYKSNPSLVIDLGCGECEWKRWFPNITGIDTTNNPWTMADIIGPVDNKFFKENQNKFDCGMSLNAVFLGWNTEWHSIVDQIHSMMGLVKDRFLFTATVNPQYISKLPEDLQSPSNYNLLMRKFVDIISDSNYELELLDIPSHRDGDNWSFNWNAVDFRRPPHCNIRFILKHKK